MKHSLKIWPQYYVRVANGTKTFEVRNNDRGFQPGDIVELREWDPTPVLRQEPIATSSGEIFRGGSLSSEPYGFTESPTITKMVGYVLPLESGRVVFSLLPMPQAGEK